MSKTWDRYKNIGLGMVGILIIFSLITAGITIRNYRSYCYGMNQAILGIIEEMSDGVLTDEELIFILQGDYMYESDRLERYGYHVETDSYLVANEQNLALNLVKNIAIIDGTLMICMMVFLYFWRKRNLEIEDITECLYEMNQGNYHLNIDKNTEDELSILRNELYKTTIMLKEQAELAQRDKHSVKTNIVDISHQLKTPLTSITIMIDNMVEDKEMPDDVKEEFILDIQEKVLHMEFLLQNLLKLSKFDANVITFHPTMISVHSFIQDVEHHVKYLLEEKNIKLVYEEELGSSFTGDYKWQLEAISNIVKNGIEHSRENSEIRILWEENQFYTKITIEDYGSGIDQDKVKRIFDRFYRDQYSDSTSVGVGLHLARAIIEKDCGTVEVESQEGVSTKFVIKYMKISDTD